MEKGRHKGSLFDSLSDDDLLDLAARLVNLTLQPGWATWEAAVRERRDDALENLASCDGESVRYWQGYAAALRGVLDGPEFIANRAKEIQDAKQEESGQLIDKIRVGFGVGEMSV